MTIPNNMNRWIFQWGSELTASLLIPTRADFHLDSVASCLFGGFRRFQCWIAIILRGCCSLNSAQSHWRDRWNDAPGSGADGNDLIVLIILHSRATMLTLSSRAPWMNFPMIPVEIQVDVALRRSNIWCSPWPSRSGQSSWRRRWQCRRGKSNLACGSRQIWFELPTSCDIHLAGPVWATTIRSKSGRSLGRGS
jgi:hypothetical protein